MLQDLRFTLRLIAKDRWFSAAAILALALGIGVNAAGFTLVSGVFLRERSVRDANQVFVLSWRNTAGRRVTLSHPDFEDLREQSRSFVHLAAVANEMMNISDDRGLPEQVFGARVTADTFTVFDQQPILGRVFTLDDQRQSAPPVVIVAHHIWKNRYQEDPGSSARRSGFKASPRR